MRPVTTETAAGTALAGVRPDVRGKFLFAGAEKLYVRGVTYGTFRPGADGAEHEPETVEADFAAIAEHGLNTVRLYTVPPAWLLDAAARHGLRVLVGLPWEQHVAFLEDRARARDIEYRVRTGVAACAGHPAVLAYAVGNEIPGAIVRWHGRRHIELHLERLYRAAKEEDPEGLVTYVNFPTTEYLQLAFLDVAAFNVYLESRPRFDAYLARLQHVCGERPLLMTEVGLDSRRHGEAAQAASLGWQLHSALAGGCAGAVVFAWTDEWHRGGHDVDDWDFGLTDRSRRPKPALAAVRDAFAAATPPAPARPPRTSVVVCTHDGAAWLDECLAGVQALRYPDVETIVVDDGSTDGSADVARARGVRTISLERNRGLSHARNVGLHAASGEIVAFVDDDAVPDPDWLTYLAATFEREGHAAVGGPNVPPPDQDRGADAVAAAPGGPTHVMVSDDEAEHLPGCNMAFRREALLAIGGFDERFRTAGDDVDVCWRLRERGDTLGFHAGATVWHRARGSLRAYWRQQVGYGRAEALLEAKWSERYDVLGHYGWAGRVYGRGVAQALNLRRERVYGGVWGTAPFQALYGPAPYGTLWPVLMPEWHLAVAALALLSALGALWSPLLLALPLLALAVLAPVTQALRAARRAPLPGPSLGRAARLRHRGLVALLHLVQPLARLVGRWRGGLTPWRRHGAGALAVPAPRAMTWWSETWRTAPERVEELERALQATDAVVVRGGDYDRWDLEVRGGVLGRVRLLTAVEEHGAGRQLLRARTWPRPSTGALAAMLGFALLAADAALDAAFAAATVLGVVAIVLALRLVHECARAAGSLDAALGESETSR